ncbi:iron-sulfur cluster assembly scaffold protein [Frigidibacter sp.]|uniref:iron-sulfur cluster assembly scaffold protein n=1 Tax=Frigidibacter sp. TaxID=2586418 RepID=UPI002732CCA1|nr:iron-sulfur cluster assembly scaffold protein [Frigidibacter sp.]MDP3340363.1 iron-sulfur cluster assembly scaffold protein [Frigidibacter sp.]
MLDYGEKVRDHFFNPRNAGALAGANAVGEAGSLQGGDALRLMLQIDPASERIEAARFLALGGGSAIASFSALTELVIGQSLATAQRLSEGDIAEALGGLPPERMRGPALGRQALTAAIAAFRGEAVAEPPAPRRAPPPATIAYAARLARGEAGPPAAHPLLAARRLTAPAAPVPLAPASAPIADAGETGAAIARIIEEMRPVFQRDGGDIELLAVDAGQVFVHLSGACAGCMMAGHTLSGLQARIIATLGRPMRIIPTGKA